MSYLMLVEVPVGTTVLVQGKRLKCVETLHVGACYHCAYEKDDGVSCKVPGGEEMHLLACMPAERSDNLDVIFVEG